MALYEPALTYCLDAIEGAIMRPLRIIFVLHYLLQGVVVSAAAHPNVLLIIADDMNGYGFYHRFPGVKTPHLDRFRDSAVTFDLGYCNAPACVPSRASMFSGRYPYNTGCYLNGPKPGPWQRTPFTELEALPETFQRNGYTTFGLGKLFHANPERRRWDAMWDNACYGGGFGPFPDKDHQDRGNFWGVQAFPDEDFPDVRNGADVIEFLEAEHDRPFFAVYGLWRPHTPFTAPQRFYDLYDPNALPVPIPSWREDDLTDVPPLGHKIAAIWGERYTESAGNDHLETWRKFVHAYCACTSFADWSVGRVLEALDRSEHAGNTIVIFWSDNGYHCGEKNHWEKSTLWEQAAATPLAVRVPGLTQAGGRCPRPVSAIDFYPTLVDLCALSPPATHPLDGTSLRPLFVNPQSPWDRPALTLFEEGYFSARDERYRYIRYPDGTEELYDHQVDPHEFKNLAAQPAVQEIKDRLKKWIPDTWAPSMGGRWG